VICDLTMVESQLVVKVQLYTFSIAELNISAMLKMSEITYSVYDVYKMQPSLCFICVIVD